MKRVTILGLVCAASVWAGSAVAAPTPQEACDYARITAWKVYTSCVDAVLAKDAKTPGSDQSAAFAKCRHKYFKKWAGFQAKASLAGSTCIGSRYTDNGNQTVTDNLSGLVWEKKDSAGGVNDQNNSYTWSANSSGKADGTAFQTFVFAVFAIGFGGSYGWRLPTLAELQTIVLDFACSGTFGGPGCTCPWAPCVDGALDTSHTLSFHYWSATSWTPPSSAWVVNFTTGATFNTLKQNFGCVRAVHGGL